MSTDLTKLLTLLTETAGPSGSESRISRVIEETWSPLVDSIERDRVGNLIAVKNGSAPLPRPRLLLAAHMDEIGLMVKQLAAYPDEETGSGFLRMTQVGGVDIRHLVGQTVIVHGSGEGEPNLVGIIGSLPSHMMPKLKSNNSFGYDELVVDVGLPYRELVEQVTVGDFITFRQPFRELLNQRVTGKALDNRASVAAVTLCLEYLQERQHDWDVIAVATAQEETALLGAFTSAFSQSPDAAIAIDVTFGQGPGAKDDETFELDEGPTIGLGPNFHPGIYAALNDAAGRMEMKVHPEPTWYAGGTDAFGLQVARQGIPTGLVSIPLRYMHTMVETLAIRDIKRTGRLLAEFVAGLNGDFLDEIALKMMGKE
jgi:putative aminopeptidase FrvX